MLYRRGGRPTQYDISALEVLESLIPPKNASGIQL